MTDFQPEDPDERLRRLLDSEEETRADLPAGTGEVRKSPTPVPPDVPPSVPPSGSTPPLNLPALDRDNMPLPRRVDQIDVDGTRVTPAAYNRPTGNRPVPPRRVAPPATPAASPRGRVLT